MGEPDHKPGKEAAEAIALEASRLQRLALEHEYHFLAYLLEMVLLEAWREASGEPIVDGEAPAPAPADLEALGLKG